MNILTPIFSDNELLSMLPPAELGQLRPLMTRVQLINGQTLYEAGERIEQVFFVQQGFVSMVAEADGDHLGTEVGLVGREGMVGLSVLLSSTLAISGWVACGFGGAVEERAWDCCHVPVRR